MQKISFVTVLLLLMASCKQEYSIPPLSPGTSVPTLLYPPASFASAVKFIPFGGTLPNGGVNKGYEITIADTTQIFISVDSGIVQSITPSANGGNTITVVYRKNSAYQMIYSGVSNVEVQVNDTIAPSTVLGKVSSTGIIDFKLLISGNSAACPQTYGGSGFNNGIATAIRLSNLANPADTVASPCLQQTLPD